MGQVYRLVKHDDERTMPGYWVMQHLGEQGWDAQYRFTLQPYILTDFSARCQYHQTSPEISLYSEAHLLTGNTFGAHLPQRLAADYHQSGRTHRACPQHPGGICCCSGQTIWDSRVIIEQVTDPSSESLFLRRHPGKSHQRRFRRNSNFYPLNAKLWRNPL